MTALHIHRLVAHYDLPPSARDQRSRLDGVLHTMLDESLERALEYAGVSSGEEVYIRRLRLPVQLRMSLGDSTLALDWSRELSGLIAHARDTHGDADVVCYSTPVHTLIDMAIGVASERVERAWAWRMSGHWTVGDAPSPREAITALIGALLNRPAAIAPVLTALADSRLPRRIFAALWRRIQAPEWIALGRAALVALDAPPSLIDAAAMSGAAEVGDEIRRLLSASQIARAIASIDNDGLRPASADLRRVLAVFVVLERDPAALRNRPHVRALVAGLSDALHPAARREAPITAGARGTDRTKPLDENAPVSVSQQARTEHGGLLFLLNLFAALELPDAIDAARGARPFRWMLHQLAITLALVEADDPAALAFAGLSPDAVPPSREGAPATEGEQHAIATLAARLAAALDSRIVERPSLSFVCQRPAEIVADPGWIALRFASRDADTAIRRAGLDLNPGFLPWLGSVVVFSYD